MKFNKKILFLLASQLIIITVLFFSNPTEKYLMEAKSVILFYIIFCLIPYIAMSFYKPKKDSEERYFYILVIIYSMLVSLLILILIMLGMILIITFHNPLFLITSLLAALSMIYMLFRYYFTVTYLLRNLRKNPEKEKRIEKFFKIILKFLTLIVSVSAYMVFIFNDEQHNSIEYITIFIGGMTISVLIIEIFIFNLQAIKDVFNIILDNTSPSNTTLDE